MDLMKPIICKKFASTLPKPHMPPLIPSFAKELANKNLQNFKIFLPRAVVIEFLHMD
jgi:hypothetical protein